ncbi:amino acid/polyamine/organocation transporter, APC superfamily [Colwellia chukchiensis]|uniref:Amino acid/polyamine/organocation transporter, APC superfamily n=1 Tax=Colwellia chukchiensis TaxID=641665 RepID=A0A1H7G6Z7_9GAMM|nr:APC family permease [Colwellia chukchiensis]SEK34096.1 amino acid/polyamine/organocation transporter, APC superfamily [Colwellia chukchiensis]
MNTQHVHEKTLGKRDIFLFCVSAVLLLDTLAAGAVMGPTVIFWWLLLTVVFLIPFGAISTELGSVYPEQGGIYAWVKRAYGQKMASRISWYYWANVAVWIPAIFILFAGIFSQIFFPEMSLSAQIALGLVLIWVVVFVNVVALNVGKWIPNVGAILKILIFAVLIIGGITYGLEHGIANEFTLATMIPTTENGGLSLQYLPAVVYGMLGFELASASSAEMKNPRKDLPKAVFSSIVVVVGAYILASIAILIAQPAEKIDVVDGLMDTLGQFFGGSALGDAFVVFLGIGALYTFFSNGATWAMGANRAAAEAAIDKELPSWFAIESKHGTPVGAAVLLGVSASILLLLYGFMAGNNEDLFWSLFAFSGVIFMLPYVAVCTAFVKIRQAHIGINGRIAPDGHFRFPGSPTLVKFIAYFCAAILLVTITLFIYVPGQGMVWEVLWGALSVIVIGEVVTYRGAKKLQQATV